MLLYVAHIPKLTLHGSPVHFWDGNILNARVNWHCEIFPIPILSNTGHKTHEGNIAKCDAPSDHEGAFVIAHGSSFFIHVVSSLNSAETIRDLMVSHAHKVREYRQSFESFVVGTRPVPRAVVDAVFTAQEVSLRGEVLQGIPLGTESFSGWFPKNRGYWLILLWISGSCTQGKWGKSTDFRLLVSGMNRIIPTSKDILKHPLTSVFPS